MEIVAFPTLAKGYQNQLKGAIGAVADLKGYKLNDEQFFLLPKGIESIDKLEREIYFSCFKDYQKFQKIIWEMLDLAIQRDGIVPKIVLIAYNQTIKSDIGEDVDMIGRAIKEYYQQKQLGNVLTAVISSRFYKYKYIDVVNIPKFLLTFYTRLRLFEAKEMRRKSFVSIGIINNFKPSVVQTAKVEFLAKLKKYAKKSGFAEIAAKLKSYTEASKRVVFCLGGRVDGDEIIFDLRDAVVLAKHTEKLVKLGFFVLFVNGPRTPNNVTDYLFKTFQHNSSVVFHNCKKIAHNEQEAGSWRLYSGSFEKEFERHAEIGNVYPAVLGFENTLVVHTLDTYAACETASAAIPTAVIANVPYVDKVKRYDCYNLQQLLCPKYIIDFESFMASAEHLNVEPKNLRLCVLSNPLRVFAEAVVNRMNGIGE